MKNIQNFILLTALVLSTSVFAQTKEYEEKPYIEVNGTSEYEVVPDQIYINIVIREKYENKEKVTIENQEEKLKTSLKEIGIDIANLYLSDANADYVKIKYKTKDVLTKKDYILKVTNATKLGQVFQQLDKLNINDAYIGKVSHTKIDSLKREVRVMAIKAAKRKADYLLLAIGEITGKALIVRENDTENNYHRNTSNVIYQNARFSGGDVEREVEEIEEIQFQKIKIQSSIYVKFSIK